MPRKKLPHRRLAEGEVTGHFHQASAGTLWDYGDGLMVLDAPKGATVTHQEHGPVALPPGKYERRIVLEYDHFAEEARQVRD